MNLGENKMLKEKTGLFHWTEQDANEMSKVYSKTDWLNNSYFGLYCSTIKGEPNDSRHPTHCWAVTNRYDPRIVALRNSP